MSKPSENITTVSMIRLLQEDECNCFRKEACLLLLKEGKTVRVTAQGMSMYPFIKNKDNLEITPLSGRNLRIGDIIAVNRKVASAGWFVAHRLVKISCRPDGKQEYISKGDFYSNLDDPVGIEDIAGVVTRITRLDISICLDSCPWRFINVIFARLSLKFSRALVFISKYMNLAIERKSFLSRLRNRLKKGDVIIYNTQELFLVCARTSLDDTLKQKAFGFIKEGLDWEYFCSLVMKNGLVVLVSGALDQLKGFVDIPEFVFKRLIEAQVYILPRVIKQQNELLGILKVFSENSVSVICLKGVNLSRRIYNDDLARGISADIDLLIKEEDKQKASSALCALGYLCVPDIEIKQWGWQFIFYKANATLIDLHWDITMTMRSKERIAGFWESASAVGLESARYYELNQEALLLYLCAHLTSSDACRNLKYICDLNEFIGKNGSCLDWDEIIGNARAWKLSVSLYTGLILSRKLLGTQLPDLVLRKIRPSLAKRFLIGLIANKEFVLDNKIKKKLMVGFLSYIFFDLIEARSLNEYILVFKRVFLPPDDFMKGKSRILRILKGLGKFLMPPFLRKARLNKTK